MRWIFDPGLGAKYVFGQQGLEIVAELDLVSL